LKVDIEGDEIAMLAACPDEVINRIMQISIEFHDFCGITSKKDVDKTLVRLHQLGFGLFACRAWDTRTLGSSTAGY
jgi:hypothetical protein